MKCPSCDTDGLTGIYCSNCGAKLTEDGEEVINHKKELQVTKDGLESNLINHNHLQQNKDNLSRKKIFLIIGILIAVAIIIVYYNKAESNGVQKAKENKEAQYQKGVQLIQEGKWKEAGTALYFLQQENYSDSKTLYDEANYQNGIELLKEGKWEEATLKLSSLSINNYKDGKVLYKYATARDYATSRNSYNMANYTMNEIPNSYSGIMSEEILKYKNEIKGKEDAPLIEFVDCNWHRDGNYVYYNGKVKNNSAKSVSFVKVEVVYYDRENGNVLDSDYTYAVDSNPLQPGLVKSFNLMTPYTPGMKWARCRVTDYK